MLNNQSIHLPDSLRPQVEEANVRWQRSCGTQRMWNHDSSVWTNSGEENWLGWLSLLPANRPEIEDLRLFGAEIHADRFQHAVVLGMGGSSLFPAVVGETFGHTPGCPRLDILDSTVPAQVEGLAARIDLATTLFIVASKSGSTLEPNVFLDYFYDAAKTSVGTSNAGKQFVAVTDPGSKMEAAARERGFRRTFFGKPSVGGRFSALSVFGLVPSAVAGVDLERLMESGALMHTACQRTAGMADNPGAELGVALGTLANAGRDKLTVLCSPGLGAFGAWLEQLVAESTGKHGKAVIPVDREPVPEGAGYSGDRVFAYVRLESAPDTSQDALAARLIQQGHPVVAIDVRDIHDLAQEVFRWEIATAVAGAQLGINPFDQPDVEASKIKTRGLMEAYEQTEELPAESPFHRDGSVSFYATAEYAAKLRETAGEVSGQSLISAHCAGAGEGDYFALLAYIDMNAANDSHVQAMRKTIVDATGAACCAGFGPRFLHSTGQAYKGGPNSGVFLQITAEDAEPLPIPGRSYPFSLVKAAQAAGDLGVLQERNRRALRVDLGGDTEAGLATLQQWIHQAATA